MPGLSFKTSGPNKWSDPYFLLILVAFLLFGILLFDAKLFLMGDDADYIMDAYHLVNDGIFPAGRSSLYALVLSLPVALFGTNVILLKCFSFLCALISFIVLYAAFYKRIPKRVLFPVLLFWVVNSSMQYYSSSNLSEAFFVMIQYLYLASVFHLFDRLDEEPQVMPVRSWLLIGLMGLLISLSKNIAIVAPVCLCLYFLLKKQWKSAGLSLGVFLIFKIPYELLLRLAYGKNTLQSQMGQVWAKDLYDRSKGQEDMAGFLSRLADNTRIYLGHHTLKEIGMKLENNISLVGMVILIGLVLVGIWVAYKRNQFIFFTSVYTVVMSGATFLALQPIVQQGRIIHILVPLIILLFFFGANAILQKIAAGRPLVPRIAFTVFTLIMLLANFARTREQISKNWPVFLANIDSEPFYGYTPDWVNYLEMGQWIAKNMPKEKTIAARKPNSLTIYSAGRPFYGIYSSENGLTADQLLEKLQRENIHYLVIASLRVDPLAYQPKKVISTMHSWADRIETAYPGSIRTVHAIGKLEPCYLVEVRFPEKFLAGK